MSGSATGTPARVAAATTASINTTADFAPVLRKHVTHALCAAVLAGGAWALGVRPLEASLARQTEEAARMRSEVATASMQTQQIDDLEKSSMLARERADAMLAWAGQADDATEIYDAFNRLARGSGVKVQRIDPTGTRSGGARTTNRPASTGKRPAGPSVELIGYRVAVQGTYEQLVAFLGACEADLSAARIVSFRINASSVMDDAARPEGWLDASVETAHVKITMPSAGGAAPSGANAKERTP
jgi:Tfp pilus assembly protein PilO